MAPLATVRLTGRDPATGLPLAVHVDHGRIAAIEPASGPVSGFLSAGLVDLQVNGYAGFDVNAADAVPEDIVSMVRALAAAGTTTCAPTVVTHSPAHMARAMATIAAARDISEQAAHAIAFIHVEGPSLSDHDGPRGVHPRAHLRAPSAAEFAHWRSVSGDLVGIVTLSPHWDNTVRYITHVAASGTLVSIGHTHADAQQIAQAIAAGARLSTHVGNGAHAVLPRHPNYIWEQLAAPELTAGFIADGHHLDGAALAAMIAAKGPGRALLVSDSVALAGLPPGVYSQPVGGDVQLDADGRLGACGTPYLAGAARPLAAGVAFAAGAGRQGLPGALRLATAIPGGIATRWLAAHQRGSPVRGRLRIGDLADVLWFDWEPGAAGLRLRCVLAAGRDVEGPAG